MAENKVGVLNNIRTIKRPTTGQFIWMGVGLVMAVGLFIFLSRFVACWRLTALPGMAPSACSQQTTPPVTTNPKGHR